MRVLGKVLLVLLTVVGLLGLAFGSFMAALWGFADQNAARYTYKVGFHRSGDECGNYRLSVDVSDGRPLTCFGGHGGPELPGFTDEQKSEVLALSAQLGAGGLTKVEQEQVQARVDQIAASLPPDRRPHHPWLWGWKLGVLGLLAGAGTVLLARWAIRR